MVELGTEATHLRFASIYMTSTHVALIGLALVAPTVATVSHAHGGFRLIMIGVLVIAAGSSGAFALLTSKGNKNNSTGWKYAIWISSASALTLWLITVPAGSNPILSSLAFTLVLCATADVETFRTATLRLIAATFVLLALSFLTAYIYSGSHLLDLIKASVVPPLIAAAVIAQDRVILLAAELDHRRASAAAVAVADERLRFAGDLHDIQGQYLQLMVLEAGLVAKLIERDPDVAATRARRLQNIATQALDEMHRVVHSYREVRLGDEIENAARVLRAAGIECCIEGESVVVPVMFEAAFGFLIREGVTNVLRHTRADACRILVARQAQLNGGFEYTVTLENSGPSAVSAEGGGSGLENLSDRFRRIGGKVGLEIDAGGARLTGRVSTNDRGEEVV